MTRSMSTAPIKALVSQALDSLPRPLTDDVTDDVFFAIEQNPAWLRAYTELCAQRDKATVNSWAGFWIADLVERSGQEKVPAQKSKLIQTYSKLNQPAAPRLGKAATEEAARKALFEFYKANKDKLPAEVVQVKEEIVELIIGGMRPEQAFSTALKISGLDQVPPAPI